MLARDEQALICDFAETYHVFDWKALRPSLAATLAVGLRDDSRIKMQLSGLHVPPDRLLLAAAVDRLSLLVWMETKDGQKGRNRPPSIVESMTTEKHVDDAQTFKDADAYEAAKNRIIRGL